MIAISASTALTDPLRKVSKLSATLSPTASFTRGTLALICPLALLRLLTPESSPSCSSSASSSPNASASAGGGCLTCLALGEDLGLDLGLPLPFVEGRALLGGRDDCGATGEEISMVAYCGRMRDASG